MRLSITHINSRVIRFIESVLADYYVELNKEGMFLQSSDLIEKNEQLRDKIVDLFDGEIIT